MTMAERSLAMWRGVRYLAVGIATGFASIPILFAVVFMSAVARPNAARLLRWWANRQRRRVTKFTGEPIAEPPPPDRLRDALRDLGWLGTHAFTGHILGFTSLLLPLSAVQAVLIPFYWWALPESDPVTQLYPVTSWGRALLMPPIAVAWAALALFFVPWLARWHSRWARRLLSPPPGTKLVQRVAELTASRAAALDAHGAELRRIERDLHDGTQNRLVAVAMHLGIVERALRRDGPGALPMVLKAQDAASDALAGLRDVVRSIYPPVLAERGLDGAIDGLIARCPVPCTLTVTGLRRAPAAVESAAYFVVAEALTNVAKHSGADNVEVRLSTSGPPEVLTIEVTDDGHGGADETAGTGLAGIRRRVAAYDGETTVTSPPGGPTVLRVELPCGS